MKAAEWWQDIFVASARWLAISIVIEAAFLPNQLSRLQLRPYIRLVPKKATKVSCL
ncbi:MAG: hypothetical protein KA435_09205 [Azonexus sp.]|nr:hypothetical protein [Azonexus sp.]